ncbi:G-protein-signaling modulator 2 [Parambassis ranga]|uniref:G-protein-signaling modulator 2 n=1 Tax=Parambassis ranga TaxID=210632 RepID=A0A6P7J249_9TELE|nr:G-protein-signaling modulator 2-like [Parambassis ranga]
MADRKPSGFPPPSLSPPPPHPNRRIGGAVPKNPHQNGSVDSGPGQHSNSSPASSSRTPPSASPLRTFRPFRGLMTPTSLPSAEGSCAYTRPRGQSLSSALSSRMRTKRRNSQQEEPEALLDLILESQCQRLEDQRASLSLLPNPGPAGLCGTCSPDQPPMPSLDFYYMLIHYQSDRMEDQRCSLPDLDDVVGQVPEGQEDFFSLVQRVQSRRMDEQRASMLLRHTEDDEDSQPAGSSTAQYHHHLHRH